MPDECVPTGQQHILNGVVSRYRYRIRARIHKNLANFRHFLPMVHPRLPLPTEQPLTPLGVSLL